MRLAWMGCDWSMCQNLNNVAVFWMNQAHMRHSVVGRWRVAGSIRSLVNTMGLELQCLRVLHRPSSCLSLCMIVKGEEED